MIMLKLAHRKKAWIMAISVLLALISGFVWQIEWVASPTEAIILRRDKQLHVRKLAMAEADIVALDSNIEFLEKSRNQSIAELLRKSERPTNANALVVQLLAESQIYSPVPISNVAGLDMFVDPWGSPYKFTLVTNAEAPSVIGRHLKKRIVVESASTDLP